MTEAATIKEVMTQYDQKRAEWIAARGDDRGFDRWFTIQATAQTLRMHTSPRQNKGGIIEMVKGSKQCGKLSGKKGCHTAAEAQARKALA